MNLEPSEEQGMLRDLVRRFLADRVDAAAIGSRPMSRDDWVALGELGLFAFLLPERGGGMGGAPQDAMIVAEELGRALAITPFAESILGAAGLVARYGTDDQVAGWVGPAQAGSVVLALAVGDVTVRDGALHGRCDFVRWAADADAVVVLSGETAFLVPAGSPGLTNTAVRLADGSTAAMMVLESCVGERISLPAGEVDTCLALVQLGYVAELVGAMALLYDQTVDYVRQRKQFGAAIGTFQVVQHKLARMFVSLEQARSLLLKAGVSPREVPGFVNGVLGAKAYVAEAAQRLAEEAVQLHGSIGVTEELAIGRGLKRVLVLGRLFGSAEEARQRLAA